MQQLNYYMSYVKISPDLSRKHEVVHLYVYEMFLPIVVNNK